MCGRMVYCFIEGPDRCMSFTLSLKDLNIQSENGMLISAVSRALHGTYYCIYRTMFIIYKHSLCAIVYYYLLHTWCSILYGDIPPLI